MKKKNCLFKVNVTVYHYHFSDSVALHCTTFGNSKMADLKRSMNFEREPLLTMVPLRPYWIRLEKM